MTENQNNSGGFLKGRFESCPQCGELISTDSSGCRYCGWVRGGESVPFSVYAHPERVAVPETTQEPNCPGTVRQYVTRYTSQGNAIPPEYCDGFDPDQFSYPAFLCADLWHAEKGLFAQASKHFVLRLITSIFFALAVILLFNANGETGETTGAAAGLGFLFLLLCFGGLIACAAAGATDARVAYRRYIESYNTSIKQGNFNDTNAKGVRTFWGMLYVPFVFYLTAFLLMLASVGGK